MREIEIRIPPTASLDHADALVEGCCQSVSLRLTLKDTLKQYPGCIHWHYKQDDEKGTLEITLWRAKRRLWFKISAGRQGAWMEAVIKELTGMLETGLKQ